MERIQDAGLRMKLQHDKNRFGRWSQIGKLISPTDICAFRTRRIKLSSFISGRANFAGRERAVVPVARRRS